MKTYGLVHHWKFDKKTGIVAKDTISGVNLTLKNSDGSCLPQFVQEGPLNNVVRFKSPKSNCGNFIIADQEVLRKQQFSISFWVCPNKGQSQKTGILGNLTSNFRGFGIEKDQFSQNYYHIRYGTGKQFESSDNFEIPNNQWSFVAVIFGKDTLSVYINAKKVCEQSNSVYIFEKCNSFVIGCSGWDQQNEVCYFSGAVADVRIYNKLLQYTEILNGLSSLHAICRVSVQLRECLSMNLTAAACNVRSASRMHLLVMKKVNKIVIIQRNIWSDLYLRKILLEQLWKQYYPNITFEQFVEGDGEKALLRYTIMELKRAILVL